MVRQGTFRSATPEFSVLHLRHSFRFQNNQNNRIPKKVGPLLYKVAFGKRDTTKNATLKYWTKLLSCVLCNTAIDLNKAVGQNAEDTRIRWTNDKCISMWFDNWENDLVDW